MVTYSATDVIPMRNFIYEWRITDDRWDSLPSEILEHIIPLSSERSEQICQRGRAFRQEESPHAPSSSYHTVSQCSLESVDSADDEHIQQWFKTLPIKQIEQVYISWGDNVAAITEWSIFTKVWNSLWYTFDAVEVFDDTLKWAVLFGPEEIATYLELFS